MYTRIDHTTENSTSQLALASESLREPLNPHSEAATQLQSMANESLQIDRLHTYQRMANAHSEKQEVTQLQHLADDSDSVMQLKAIRGGGYLKGTVKYTPQNNNGSNSAYLMEASNIELKDPNVASLAGNHSPSVDPPGWTGIQGLGITKKAPFYKRMHLLNGELGGSGADVENLAPGSTDLNNAHAKKVENKLQKYVLNGGKILSYNVWAFYRTSGLNRMSSTTENIYKSSLHSICCEYELDDGTNMIQKIEITEDKQTAQNWPD